MLFARLRAPKGEPSLEIQTSFLHSVGVSMRDADGQEIAVHIRGLWHREGRNFLSIDLQGTVQFIFENPTFDEKEKIGPVEGVQIINSGLWINADGSVPKLVAEFDLSLEAWHLRLRPGVAMPVLTIAPAGA